MNVPVYSERVLRTVFAYVACCEAVDKQSHTYCPVLPKASESLDSGRW